MTNHYAGSDWIERNITPNLSPLGKDVADFLGDMFLGIYHLSHNCLRRVDWKNDHHITFSLTHKPLSTIDFDELTILVVLAHDQMLRVELDAVAPRNIQFTFHKRKSRDGIFYERCPTIEDHVKSIRDNYIGEGDK